MCGPSKIKTHVIIYLIEIQIEIGDDYLLRYLSVNNLGMIIIEWLCCSWVFKRNK